MSHVSRSLCLIDNAVRRKNHGRKVYKQIPLLNKSTFTLVLVSIPFLFVSQFEGIEPGRADQGLVDAG